jgi:hypothetical protein
MSKLKTRILLQLVLVSLNKKQVLAASKLKTSILLHHISIKQVNNIKQYQKQVLAASSTVPYATRNYDSSNQTISFRFV